MALSLELMDHLLITPTVESKCSGGSRTSKIFREASRSKVTFGKNEDGGGGGELHPCLVGDLSQGFQMWTQTFIVILQISGHHQPKKYKP